MKTPVLTLLAAAGLSLFAARLHAQTILNGSFESPALPSGSYAAGSGDNWTTGGSGGAYVLTNGFGSGTTPYGTQFEYLFSGATDAQTVSGAFTLGRVYTLSLAASALSTGATQLTVMIAGGVSASQSFTLAGRTSIGNTPIPFVTYSLTFTPTSGTATTFTFSDTGSSVLAMDNVQIAPEPSTWALVGLGAVGLGVAAMRRRAVRG